MYFKSFFLGAIILVLSLATHFFHYGRPHELVFDEVYFGKFASGYLTHSYYFDIHPPLGKLIISGFGYMMGVRQDDTNYELIGNDFSPEISFWYRLLPTVFAALLPLLIYILCLQLRISPKASFVAGLLLVFENSLVAHSRFTSLDSMLLCFGFTSLVLYLAYLKKEKNFWILILSAVFTVAAFSIKWTGLAFPLLISIMELTRVKPTRRIIKFFCTYFFVGIIFYLSIFAIHFSILTEPGPGDAFMPENFQQDSFLKKTHDLNLEMFSANARLMAPHPYSSKWYTWPFMYRTVFYWQDVETGSYIYFLGNVLVYWLGTLAFIWVFVKSVSKNSSDFTRKFVIVGYLVNFIPFIFIGRVMFIYHYQAALVFSVIAISICLDMIGNDNTKKYVGGGLVLAAFCLFIYFSPLTYGLPLSEKQLQERMWLSTWR